MPARGIPSARHPGRVKEGISTFRGQNPSNRFESHNRSYVAASK